jgi:hypothetical protein
LVYPEPASLCTYCSQIALTNLYNDSRCDVLTFEIEHVDAATLERLEKQGVVCEPKASTIMIIQVVVPFLCQPSSSFDSFVLQLLACATHCR